MQHQISYTLWGWLETWIDTFKDSKVKPRTATIYRDALTLIKKNTNDLSLTDVTEMDLQSLLNRLWKKEYAKSTIAKVLSLLRQSLHKATRLHYIPENPTLEIELPNAPTKKVFPLTQTEQMLVESACHELPLGFIFIFLLRTGLRREELMGLQWQDYDAKESTIFIRESKTTAGIRTVPLMPEAQAIIEAQPRYKHNYIFCNTKARPIQDISFRRTYNRIRRITGVTEFTNHTFRHTFVTRCCEAGLDAKAISQLIGHARPDYVLSIYAHMEKRTLRREILRLAECSVGEYSNTLVALPDVVHGQYSAAATLHGMKPGAFLAMLLERYVTVLDTVQPT